MIDLFSSFFAWCFTFWPQPSLSSSKERVAASIGAAIGLIGTEWLCRQTLGEANPWFIAPMGASAVLLFGVPASPLAQPWSIVGGNLLASLVGVTCVYLLGNSGIAAGVAVAVSIGLMFPFRCLHPPSGAVALTAVIGGPAITKLGFYFIFYPVLMNSLFLTVFALLFNNALRRRFPHHVQVPLSAEEASVLPSECVGVSREDLRAVLSERGELLDIDERDLQEVLLQAESRAHRRHFGNLRCVNFMTKNILTINPEASCLEACFILRDNSFDVLPVTSSAGKVIGVVTAQDLLPTRPSKHSSLTDSLVIHVMRKKFHISDPNDAVESLVIPFSDELIQCSIVIDEKGLLVGLVTASDVLAALYQEQLEKLHSTSFSVK